MDVTCNDKENGLMSDETLEDQLKELDADEDLDELNKELMRFNLFDAFDMRKNENRHSAILRWLLDPTENHGVNDLFLRSFLEKVLSKNRDKTSININSCDLKRCIVRREKAFPDKRRPDIVILNEYDKLYVLIENKIDAKERNGQTVGYAENAKMLYPTPPYTRVLIYLTPDEKPAKAKDDFLLCSYNHLKEVIDEIADDIKLKAINEGYTEFILEQLKRNIEVNILHQSNINESAAKIYFKHKKAIDYLYKFNTDKSIVYEKLGETVISLLNKQTGKQSDKWSCFPDKKWCIICKSKWAPNRQVPFFHYEIDDIQINHIRIGFHVEEWVGNETDVKDFKKELKNAGLNETVVKIINSITNLSNTKIDLEDKRDIITGTVITNLDDLDEAIETVAEAMVDFIGKTEKYVNEAFKEFEKKNEVR